MNKTWSERGFDCRADFFETPSHKQEGSHISVFGCVKKNKKKPLVFHLKTVHAGTGVSRQYSTPSERLRNKNTPPHPSFNSASLFLRGAAERRLNKWQASSGCTHASRLSRGGSRLCRSVILCSCFRWETQFFFFKGYQELFSSIAVELNLPHLGDQTLLSLPLLCTEHYPLWRRGAKSNAEISFLVHVNIVWQSSSAVHLW